MRNLLLAVAAALLLAGCAAPNLAMPPITSLENRTCATEPDFSHATALQVHAKDVKVTKAVVDQAAPCFADTRGASAYTVFSIPPLSAQYTIQVDSTPAGNALFAPRILLYDKDGVLKRSMMEKQIAYRGSNLSAVFRNHDDEAYIVVASDPAACGERNSRINDSTNVTTICTGYFCFQVHSGNESMHTMTLTHNGRLEVSLIPIAKPK